jgi:hypothetical protein
MGSLLADKADKRKIIVGRARQVTLMPTTWLDETLTELAAANSLGYLPASSAAAEPTAIAGLAFYVHDRPDAARRAASQLIEMQQSTGNVGIRAGETPGWPTSLAIVAWSTIDRAQYRPNIDSSTTWLLANRGQAIERSADFGHNTELVGWSYAEKTHSWVEPTAFSVLALKSANRAQDPACREGIAVLLDRQLPGGGLNYGNTYVLGQLIRPHVQPTGIALLALAREPNVEPQIAKSLAWLRRSIGPETTPQSLAWALLGLRAHGIELPEGAAWLAAGASRVRRGDRSPYKLALLALAQKEWPK